MSDKMSDNKKIIEDKVQENHSAKKDFSKKKSQTSVIDIEQLKKAGIFTGIIVVLAGLLIGLSLGAGKFWRNGLKQKLSSVLNENGIEVSVGNMVEIESVISSSCAIYEISSSYKPEGSQYGVILRETTMYGPLAAVFVYDAITEKCDFVNYADVKGSAQSLIIENTINSQIQYWEKRIPEIIKTSTNIISGTVIPEDSIEGE